MAKKKKKKTTKNTVNKITKELKSNKLELFPISVSVPKKTLKKLTVAAGKNNLKRGPFIRNHLIETFGG